jgi:predicted Zn-dependent protease
MIHPSNKIAIISITRLKPNYYGLREKNELLLKMAGTEAMNEIWHIC